MCSGLEVTENMCSGLEVPDPMWEPISSAGQEKAREENMGYGVCFCGGLLSVNLTKLELHPPESFFLYGSGRVRTSHREICLRFGSSNWMSVWPSAVA